MTVGSLTNSEGHHPRQRLLERHGYRMGAEEYVWLCANIGIGKAGVILRKAPPLSLVRVKVGEVWVTAVFDDRIGRIKTFLPHDSRGKIDAFMLNRYSHYD